MILCLHCLYGQWGTISAIISVNMILATRILGGDLKHKSGELFHGPIVSHEPFSLVRSWEACLLSPGTQRSVKLIITASTIINPDIKWTLHYMLHCACLTGLLRGSDPRKTGALQKNGGSNTGHQPCTDCQ